MNGRGGIDGTIGMDPTSMGTSEIPRIPVRTEVGQSGPPTRIADLPSVRHLGSESTSLIARTAVELTPTAERTPTLVPRPPPMTFCCMMMASILVSNAKKIA